MNKFLYIFRIFQIFVYGNLFMNIFLFSHSEWLGNGSVDKSRLKTIAFILTHSLSPIVSKFSE